MSEKAHTQAAELAVLTEREREVLSSLCDVDAPRGAGHDGYCYKHYAPVKWAGRANADEVCCVDVEDKVEQVLALHLPSGQRGGDVQ